MNYLGQDRSDTQHAVMEVCQGMSSGGRYGEDQEGSPDTWLKQRGERMKVGVYVAPTGRVYGRESPRAEGC